jgi:hypothetical protein
MRTGCVRLSRAWMTAPAPPTMVSVAKRGGLRPGLAYDPPSPTAPAGLKGTRGASEHAARRAAGIELARRPERGREPRPQHEVSETPRAEHQRREESRLAATESSTSPRPGPAGSSAACDPLPCRSAGLCASSTVLLVPLRGGATATEPSRAINSSSRGHRAGRSASHQAMKCLRPRPTGCKSSVNSSS